METEIRSIIRAIRFCLNNNITNVIFETDSLALANIINRVWKVSWQYIKEIEEIQDLREAMQAIITHGFREANQLETKWQMRRSCINR